MNVNVRLVSEGDLFGAFSLSANRNFTTLGVQSQFD